ncbi:MAG TPA: tetratricopeptide repeat protein, partial [Blastocatellia bacterium]|nr:tetratricopeptide repeat protein [Blastocatellia bacterium]
MVSTLRRIIAAVALTALVTIVAAAADWERGVALYNKGDYAAALAEFQDLVRERAATAGAWYYIGLCEFRLKRYDRVELPLSRAIALLEVQSPASADIAGAWYTIGLSHYFLSQYDKAVEPLKRYVELTAKAKREVDPSARAALGRAYFFLERYDEALLLLASANNGRAKENAVNHYYVGAIHYKREDDTRAIAALREAVKANPEDAAALELLAESLMRKAQAAKINAAWLEAAEVGEKLRAVRDDLKTANILGRAFLGAQQFDRAVAPLEKLAKASPDNGQAWL